MAAEFHIIDRRFQDLLVLNAWVECLGEGYLWAEGPCYFADGNYLLFSDIPKNRIMRWIPDGGINVYRADARNANGNTRDQQGRLVTCEHLSRSVTRTELDGTITTLVDRYRGKRLNSPNDVIVKSDGTIWFTDPSYGIMSDYEGSRADRELSGCFVFRLDPSNHDLRVVSENFSQPNGLCFSPDESILYIADSGASHDKNVPSQVRAFPVDGTGLGHGQVFANIDAGVPDGLRVDERGNLWVAAGDGIHCFSPDGTLLGKILIPETVANLTFGGPKRNRLFITATRSLYAVYVAVRGAQRP
jgi:gluconolactonase